MKNDVFTKIANLIKCQLDIKNVKLVGSGTEAFIDIINQLDLQSNDEIIIEAKERREELLTLLSNTDKELSNELHKIELEKSKNAYQGFLEYKQLKYIMEKRRNIKDELMIISNVLRMDFRNFSAASVDKAIKGLATRKFTMRVMEGDEDEILQGL